DDWDKLFKSRNFPYGDEKLYSVKDFINESPLKKHLEIVSPHNIDYKFEKIRESLGIPLENKQDSMIRKQNDYEDNDILFKLWL
ncbi:MAG: hypothetical protein MHPSP_004669, partial [Paramarteilia canceri]